MINEVGPCLAAFNLEFYTDVQDLSYLQEYLDRDPRSAKYRYFSVLFSVGFVSHQPLFAAMDKILGCLKVDLVIQDVN